MMLENRIAIVIVLGIVTGILIGALVKEVKELYKLESEEKGQWHY